MSLYITKQSGEKELFDIKKFRASLRKAGADDELIDQIIAEVHKQKTIKTTKELYAFALSYLSKKNRPIAARYNLKNALINLGPTGFPFEKFVEKLFVEQGYTTQLGQQVQGWCVTHEIDLIISGNKKHAIVECKFHNKQKLKSDVKVPLYIKARFDDIKKAWNSEKTHARDFHQAYLVTNTKFTLDAVAYAQCMNISLLSWNYPLKNSLPDLIQRYNLHPITALTSLTKYQQKACIKKGFVLCNQATEFSKALHSLGFTADKANALIEEAQAVCSLTKKKGGVHDLKT